MRDFYLGRGKGGQVPGQIAVGTMGKVPLAVAMGLCLALAQVPAAVPANPKLQRQYAKLEADAATQHGPKKAETLAHMAEVEFDFAHAGYLAEQPQEGARQLDLAAQHAEQACQLLQAESTEGKSKGMKNVEVSIQKIAYGLGDLAQRVHFRERPEVEAMANHFADLRAQLLALMFAPKKKDAG